MLMNCSSPLEKFGMTRARELKVLSRQNSARKTKEPDRRKMRENLWELLTYGSGYPFALHTNVTLLPSRTTISLLVDDSTIMGGTENDRKLDKSSKSLLNLFLNRTFYNESASTYQQLVSSLSLIASDLKFKS